MFVTKTHKLVKKKSQKCKLCDKKPQTSEKKSHKNVKLCDKKSQNIEKIDKAVNLCGKKSQTSAKKSQKFLCDKTSPYHKSKFTKL